MKRIKIRNVHLIFILVYFYPLVNIFSQTGSYFNQRDDQYRLLGLKRAKEAYDIAAVDFERVKKMYEKKMISEQDLDKNRLRFADAEVNYQQSLLAVLFEKQFVSVLKAVKYQAKDGNKYVKLTVANTSGGTSEFKKLLNIEDELFQSIKPDVIHDVYISLLNSENAIISQPYELKIEELRYGSPAVLEFALLQDLDAVTVDIIYGNGSQRSPKIYLSKDSSEDKVIVQSEQFSQEVELGGEASFDLTLELFSGLNENYRLTAVNLPKQINRYFIDPVSGARLSQFKFTELANTRNAELKIFLPERPVDDVKIDSPISFYVLIIPIDKFSKLEKKLDKHLNPEEFKKLNIGYVQLELIPRGMGKLFVRARQLYHAIKSDEIVELSMDFINEGSRRLDNVEIETDIPLNWTKDVSPQIIPSLEIHEEKKVNFRFIPPVNVTMGRYEFRVKSSSLSDDRPVYGEEKNVIVEILPETNVLGTLIVVFLIIAIVGGIVVFGIRLSRR